MMNKILNKEDLNLLKYIAIVTIIIIYKLI